ncbi:MAG: alpha/beta fold hydrolase [Alphaproteobacteria bacterium]
MNSSEKVEFIGHDGVSRLAARLDTPEGGARAVALFAHCFTCSKDIRAASRIAGALAARGFAVLRFDFTGLGASEGEFANTNFTSNVQDLIAAGRFLEQRGQAPQVLVGHSLGGAAVIAAAGKMSSVKAVATIGAPADPAHVAHLVGGKDKAKAIRDHGSAEVEIAGRKFTISSQFLDDIAEQNVARNLAELKRALLIFHSPLDNVVGIDNAAAIFTAAKHPKSFVSLDNADHLLSRSADARYVADVLAAWAGRYIDDGEEQEPRASTETAPPVPEGYSVMVAETGTGAFTQSVRTGRHLLTADEPEKVGGNDRGPGPHAYLLSGLGACTSMTLRMYARRKEWDIGRISVALAIAPIDKENPKAGNRITRRIAVAGPLDPEQRSKLLEIADKCPVHRTLSNPLEIVTELEG